MIPMSIDKSLRRKNSLERARNVLTRGERIRTMQKEERWQDGRSPFGLPKVRVHRIVVKKPKKAKEEEKPAAEGEAAAAAAATPPAEEKKERKGGKAEGKEK
jgi:small basic protein (TIGR04137 family)